MRDAKGRFVKGHPKPENAYNFPNGELNPAKQPEVRNKLREDKLGDKNPMFGKHHSMEHRIKASESLKGPKNHLWKGGVTPINAQIRKSLEYKAWRTAVFERDKYTCQHCGARNGSGKKVILNADHIIPFCDYPELRFAIDNGRTLCVKCHHSVGWRGNQFRCVS